MPVTMLWLQGALIWVSAMFGKLIRNSEKHSGLGLIVSKIINHS